MHFKTVITAQHCGKQCQNYSPLKLLDSNEDSSIQEFFKAFRFLEVTRTELKKSIFFKLKQLIENGTLVK